ncbi:MAG: EamA family transporter RarD [Microbacterium sp.]|uniref:EamA family transporter RarD n=1 Tax=Microbacterium sp. TaxID=51671 RepID=UPI003A88DED0
MSRLSSRAVGAVCAFAAYLLWGLFPLYFLALEPSGPWEIVSWRVVLTLVVCLVLLTLVRGWAALARVARRPRLLVLTALAGTLVFVNWGVYLLAVLTGHVVEASLGYFINPIVTVLLAVLVLRERLRLAQWIAVGVALVAVLVIVVGYGEFPWFSFVLAITFGFYGLVKSHIGPSVDAVSGLALETAWLTPVAIGVLLWVGATSGLTMGELGPGHAVLLSLAGVVTAAPLLLFAAAARRTPLSIIGLLQFLTPIMQFLIGVWLLHEAMPVERWIGFALVWVSLVVLTVDQFVVARRARTPRGVADVTEPI